MKIVFNNLKPVFNNNNLLFPPRGTERSLTPSAYCAKNTLLEHCKECYHCTLSPRYLTYMQHHDVNTGTDEAS